MIYDLIIIGGGPAGITAGIYAVRKKLNTLLITKDFFGQISKTGQVDNWPGENAISGIALMQKLEKHLKQFPIEIKTGHKVVSAVVLPTLPHSQGQGSGVEVQIDSGEKYQGRSLIVATGRNAKTLGIEGEQNFVGKGLSYCSICDAPFFRDKQVAVVGCGNAGFETALDLAKFAKKVFIFEKGDKILADEILREQAQKAGNITINLKTEILKIEGDKKIQSIVYKTIENHKEFQQPMDGVFVQIGSIPATGFLGNLVDFDKNNSIKINDKTLQASVKGIFAAGDCNDTTYKQLIIAAGQGATAALSAYEYLQNKT
ncbi:MAG: FAD-dependent oxidoreductase [Candidatus Pacebacteria bacterium]|nr:FAD-dependent oxidoreductase [Candidatus Paceibacterota bacterium]